MDLRKAPGPVETFGLVLLCALAVGLFLLMPRLSFDVGVVYGAF